MDAAEPTTATSPSAAPTTPSTPHTEVSTQAHALGDELVEDDLLVEAISIDGMCGVY